MRRTFVSLILAAAAITAVAKPENVTDGELALTPPYCPDTQGFKYGDAYSNTSPRAAHWVGLMGKSFWALHHYCWALINLHRSQMAGVSPMIRRGMLESVINDYNYVVTNSTPDFVLLPEIHTRIGEAQLLLGNPGAAFDSFVKARTIKPDYWPPYQRWADVLIKTGRKGDAKKLVAEGLRYSPDAKPLLDQYRQLGGDPAEIKPVAKKAALPASASAELPPASSASATSP
jgi:hypothetical protein